MSADREREKCFSRCWLPEGPIQAGHWSTTYKICEKIKLLNILLHTTINTINHTKIINYRKGTYACSLWWCRSYNLGLHNILPLAQTRTINLKKPYTNQYYRGNRNCIHWSEAQEQHSHLVLLGLCNTPSHILCLFSGTAVSYGTGKSQYHSSYFNVNLKKQSAQTRTKYIIMFYED